MNGQHRWLRDSYTIIRYYKKLDEEYNYIEKIKVRSKLPGFMDLMHFIFADKNCEVFVTTDSSFEKLEKIQTKKLKKLSYLMRKVCL